MRKSPSLKLFDANGNYAGCVKTLSQASEVLFWAPQEFAECRYGHKKSDTLFAWNASHDSGEANVIQTPTDIKHIMISKMSVECIHNYRKQNLSGAAQ